jgi:hypothetical protein
LKYWFYGPELERKYPSEQPKSQHLNLKVDYWMGESYMAKSSHFNQFFSGEIGKTLHAATAVLLRLGIPRVSGRLARRCISDLAKKVAFGVHFPSRKLLFSNRLP